MSQGECSKQMPVFHSQRSRKPLWKLMKGALGLSWNPRGQSWAGKQSCCPFLPTEGQKQWVHTLPWFWWTDWVWWPQSLAGQAMASQEAVVSLLTQVHANRTTHLQQTTNPLFHLTFIAHSLSLPSACKTLLLRKQGEEKHTWRKRVSEVLVFPSLALSRERFSNPRHPSTEVIWRDMAGSGCGPLSLPWLKRVNI